MKKLKRKKSKCPWCGGCKVKPYMGPGVSQDCTSCDSNGRVDVDKLIEMGLEDFIVL